MRIKKKKLLLFVIIISAISTILVCFLHYLNRQEGGEKPPPNILLISLDDCRADHLSCFGYSRETSPFIDELVSQGTVFTNAFVNTHGTPSSHATIFSSLYQETHGLGLNITGNMHFWALSPNVPLIQEILQQNGYITVGVAGVESFKHMGLTRGFHEFEFSDRVSEVASISKKMIKLIKKYINQDKPIFAFFHTFEIHSPYNPPKGYRNIFGKFESDFKPTSANLLKFFRDSSKLSDSDIKFITAMYDCEIRYTDDVLKKFFEELRHIKFLKNYLVIITADHGEEFGEHGGLLHRGLLYDELLSVPLIFVGDSVKKGVVNHSMVSSVDIMPTILAYAGIKVDIPMEGRDLLSLKSISENQEQMVFSQYCAGRYSIRTHEWKLIETLLPSYKLELYNLNKDPNELTNMVDEYPDVREKFKEKLSKWKSSKLKIEGIKERRIQYKKEILEKLRTLGYIE